MSIASKKSEQKEEAIATLKGILKEGDTVWTVLRHVSSSGMSRCIDVYIIRDNEPRWLSYYAAKALGWRYSDSKESVVVDGCGMNMGFHLVDSLGWALGMKLNQRWL